MDIWTYGHVAVMQDVTLLFRKFLPGMLKNKNMGNLQVLLGVYSLLTYCHIRRFVRICFVTYFLMSF
jgi:hypothetical protein